MQEFQACKEPVVDSWLPCIHQTVCTVGSASVTSDLVAMIFLSLHKNMSVSISALAKKACSEVYERSRPLVKSVMHRSVRFSIV
jgi:hypothetical protein